MSVTIYGDVSANVLKIDRPCLCAQMSDAWLDAYNANGNITTEQRQKLQENANPSCGFCNGTGVEAEETDDAPYMNLSNDNAKLFFAMLGIKDYAMGEMSLPEARRAIMRAMARGNLNQFTRKEDIEYGKPREVTPGVYDIKPLKRYDVGVDENKLQEYLERFKQLVHDVSQRGGTKIRWD